jgi:hypothetical protein
VGESVRNEETQMWSRCFRRLKFLEVGTDVALKKIEKKK